MKSKLVRGTLAGLAMLACLAGCNASQRQGSGSTSVAASQTSPNDYEVQADVVAVGSDSIQVLGESGLTVTVDDSTTYKDSRDGVDPFSISDIQVGDRVKINIPSDSDPLVASSVERRSAKDSVELQGTADNVSAADGTFTILDVLITTDDQTVYMDSDGNVISSTEFFDAIASGTPTEVSGMLQDDGSVLASEASLLL